MGNERNERIGKNERTKTFKFLGLNLDDSLDWEAHIKTVRKKASSGCYGLSTSRHFIPLKARLNIYHSLILSHLLYGHFAFGCAVPKLLAPLETLQKRAVRHVALGNYNAHTVPLFKKFKLLTLLDSINFSRALFVHKLVNDRLPEAFSNYFQYLKQVGGDRNRSEDGKIFIPTFRFLKNTLS